MLLTSFYFLKKTSINTEISTEYGKEKEFSSSPSSFTQDTTFLIGAIESGIDTGFQNLDDVGFNAWHKYTDGKYGWSNIGATGDSLFADINTYRAGVRNKLAAISSHGMKSIIHRPKIAMLCYGQRSDYQCDSVPLNDDLWFYSFQSPNHVGIDTNDIWQGQTQRVRYCKRNIQTTDGGAGWVVSRLKSNSEQCATWADASGIISPDIKNWKVKPRIRIDTTFAQLNLNALVCNVKVIGQNGDTLRNADIRARNFSSPTIAYNGKYIEEYFFEDWSDTSSLEIDGLWGSEVGRTARGNDTVDHPYNKIDIQVYWYGNCDMWIDYVRVDNFVADRLLSGIDLEFNNWLSWEAQDIACYSQSSAIKFYLELFAFSNIPCMSYVSQKLNDLCTKDITVTALMSPLYMHMIVPWNERFSVMNAGHVITNYVEKVGLTDILIANYPFYTNKQSFPYQEETFSKIPNTLPVTSGNGVLANAIPPANYDTWLQDNLDHSPAYFEEGSTMSYPWTDTARQWEGAFRWSMELGDAISKTKDIPFLYNGQSHLWYYAEGESHKEPTNEEMEMIANVSLTYGVRGLLYFFYGWWDGGINNGDTCLYPDCFGRGFVDPGNVPRDTNAYGQNKWEMIKNQVQRLKTWEPYIMSFDNANRKSYILRLERNDLISETFFNDVITYKPFGSAQACVEDDPGSNPSGMVYECKEDRYLQVAAFQNTEPNTKYFMVVNRRCSPYLNDSTNNDNNGGRRFVKIKLDSLHSDFTGFNNWSVINVENDSVVAAFDKRMKADINLGWFLPGEGKLYKLAPVMQEGGTLVADESVIGVTSFNCNGDVNNDGKNISLYVGTTVNFADGVKWNITGGEFKSGLFPDSPNQLKVNMKSQSGAYWSGIDFTGCDLVNVSNTNFENVKLSGPEIENPSALQFVDCYDMIVSGCKFNFSNLDSISCINLNYIETEDEIDVSSNILYNEFNTGNNQFSTIICAGFAESVIPIMINGNDFNSTKGNIAIFLCNVSAGVIKNNDISNYSTGINVMSSTSYVDLYNNDIDGDSSISGAGIYNGTINLG